jgi:aryl-alcohol dehydrogenase-like predicted oxidoreductase
MNSNASAAGIFKLGGELAIHRLGFGAMRIDADPPEERAESLRTLKRLPELGIDFIDTADAYGPDVSEQLICEALHPYSNIVVATKGGLVRGGRDDWSLNGRPEYLIGQAHKSLKKLKLEQITLWQLHRIDPNVPREEQFGAVRRLLDEGVIRYAGLSEVSVEEIEAARTVFPVATVQNRYNLGNRKSQSVLEHCERHRIGFIPWAPLGAGDLARGGDALNDIAKAQGAKPGQIALAWLLQRSPVMLPIPGTSKVKHLEENVAAANIRLSAEQMQRLELVA